MLHVHTADTIDTAQPPAPVGSSEPLVDNSGDNGSGGYSSGAAANEVRSHGGDRAASAAQTSGAQRHGDENAGVWEARQSGSRQPLQCELASGVATPHLTLTHAARCHCLTHPHTSHQGEDADLYLIKINSTTMYTLTWPSPSLIPPALLSGGYTGSAMLLLNMPTSHSIGARA